MTEHNIFYPYAFLTNAQLSLLKVSAQYFEKFYILDPVSDHQRGSPHPGGQMKFKDAGVLQMVTPADVLTKSAGPITGAVRRDMRDGDVWIYSTSRSRAHTKNEVKRLSKIKGEKA
jgi:hypothetical protein